MLTDNLPGNKEEKPQDAACAIASHPKDMDLKLQYVAVQDR